MRELSGSFGRLSSFLSDVIFNKKSEFHKLHQRRASHISTSGDAEDGYLFVLLGALKVWSELVFKKALRESMATGVSPFHAAPGRLSLGDDEDLDEIDYSARDYLPLTERFPEYTVQLLSIIFTSISSFGARLGDIDVPNPSRQIKLRETAAICLIRMLKVKSVGKGISSAEWQSLAWTLLDENKECRANIMHALGVLIQTHCVHPRFLALPCLLASDEQQHQIAEKSLLFAMKRLRCTHAELCARVMAMSDSDSEESKALRRISDDNAPECVVPYVIYLLSHHPDFPVSVDLKSAGDDERMKNIVRSVKMVFNILLSSLGKESDNLAFLMKQVNIISRYYRDRHNHSNEALHFVTKIAANVLKTHIKTQEDIQPFAGDVSLPMDLYELSDEGTTDFNLDDAGVDKAIAAASKVEHSGHHRGRGTTAPVPHKKSPSKTVSTKQRIALATSNHKKIPAPSKKKKQQSSKPMPPSAAPSRSSSRRSSVSSVSYADTRDSDDEAEMEEIEEILSSSASTSVTLLGQAVTARGGRSSTGSSVGDRWRLSQPSGRASSGSSVSRQSLGSAVGSPSPSSTSIRTGPVINKYVHSCSVVIALLICLNNPTGIMLQ